MSEPRSFPHGFPRVQGRCPACRHSALFVGEGGYVTCGNLGCTNPCAATNLLETTPPEFPLPIRPDGSHHYWSCGCLHEDLILPDGRTGHEYCESETGALGTKIPATCKHCGARCACPNHSWSTPATAPSCRWPACLSEPEQQQLADDVGVAMLGEDTPLRPDPRPGCGCVDRGIGNEAGDLP